jgi:polyhydroxyalkanoate synthesis repressor PhaR
MAKERLIKKYANRRLYDASQSRHVTLEDIREFIIQGEKVSVVEDKTGEDITRLILLQVIAEQEQFGKPILSTPLLESIIRFYGNGMQEFMSRYLEKSVETFSRQQETLQTQISKLMANAPLTTMGELAKQNLDYWTRMQESVAAAFMPIMRTPGTPGTPGAADAAGAAAPEPAPAPAAGDKPAGDKSGTAG